MLSHSDLRKKFIDFYTDKVRHHAVIPNSSLVPENDPTTLFTGSGMQPLVPYLLGESNPQGTRLVNIQRCMRAEDLDEVGNTPVHHTMFEMMGNWSLGDYFKKEQISWALEFFVKVIGLDIAKLYVTVFAGDTDAPKDEGAIKTWKEEFKKYDVVAEEGDIHLAGKGNARIFAYPKNKNWWERSGAKAGDPCGPSSEMFYDTGKPHDSKFGDVCHVNCDCRRFIELCNNIFMEYQKQADGSCKPLNQKNIDVGYGFQRILMVANNKRNDSETDVIFPIIQKLESLSDKKYGENEENDRVFKVIADHIRAATFLFADGVIPSNKERGYLLRRLIRRAIRYARKLNVKEGFTKDLAEVVVEIFKDVPDYSYLLSKNNLIADELLKEEDRFSDALDRGMKKLEHMRAFRSRSSESEALTLSGEDAFTLYESYGFPLELILEVAQEVNAAVDVDEFNKAFELHKEKSKSEAGAKFKGGLEGTSEMHVKYHTATHLLHKALRDVLGTHVRQMGSNITTERLRFDFSHDKKMTPEELKKVEDMVNEKISQALPVTSVDLPKEEAERSGALHFFGEKYGDIVKVYFIGESLESAYSKEFCGGPHVGNTSGLGKFKIVKEEAVSQGVRRIKAVLE